MAIVIGVVVALLLLVLYVHGQPAETQPFTVGHAVYEITSLPDQTVSLYNRVAPASMRVKVVASGPKKAKFVGAYGRTPEMQHCLDFDDSSDRTTDFNRCTWV